jgi:hypothetical protein
MPIRLARHAEQRMALRGITRSDIECALAHIQTTYPGNPGTLVVKGVAPNGDILKVFVRANDHNYVISAMWPGR